MKYYLAALATLASLSAIAADWNASTSYAKGATVTYAGKDYNARWINRGEVPNPTVWGPWEEKNTKAKEIFVTGGTFLMGATIETPFNYPNEFPAHPVTLSHFYLASTEVTFNDYDQYTRALGLPAISSNDIGGQDMGRGLLPVINVTWFDAIRYINWYNTQRGLPKSYNETTGELLNAAGQATRDITQVKGYRLPTEAEWEFAARNRGQDIINAWGNGLPLINGQPAANIADASFKRYFAAIAPDFPEWPDVDDGYARLAPVASFIANELGLYDMSGSVWEWTHDTDRTYSHASQTNPLGDSDIPGRIIRGASWDNTTDMHITDRPLLPVDYSNGSIGFRLARSYSAN